MISENALEEATIMDIYTTIENRRTIRDFEDRAVPEEIVEKLVEAGLKAPTNDHMRHWEFVVVNDREARKKLLRIKSFGDSEAIDGQLDSWGLGDKAQRDMYQEALPRQYSMLFNAGCLILPFFRVQTPLLHPKDLSALNEFASIWCCIENMLLAAVSEGIFGVTRIPMTDESVRIKNVVGHPDNYVLPCYMALGYPAANAKRTRQNTVSPKSKIHVSTW